jgi:2-dehydropantoate 2-reductase
VIHHLGQGNVTLGEYGRHPQERTRQLVELFCQAGIRCEVTDDLDRAHWEKLLWNIPFNGLGVGAAAGLDAVLSGHITAGGALGRCWTTQDLLEDPGWASLIRELMAEVSDGAGKLGFSIPGSFAEGLIERTRGMGAYKASTLLDYEQGKPLELKSLFVEPLRRARRAGAALPRLAALASVLTELDLLKRVAVE